MKYKISSYSKEPINDFLGHIQYTQTVDSLEEAEKVAKNRHDQGDIQVMVLKDGEEVFRYLEVTLHGG